jgi:hypothetical protein
MYNAHHAERLANPKVRAKKFALTPEHVDSENIKFLIGRWSYLYQLF